MMRTGMVMRRIGTAELKDLTVRGTTLNLSYPLSTLPRLAELMPGNGSPDPSLQLQVSATFQWGLEGYPRLHLRVAGSVPLVCQRCLGLLVYPVHLDLCLTMVGTDAEAAALSDPFETLLLTAGELELALVVEDEVLAVLPLVPKHVQTDPVGREEPTNSREMRRPLAGLADLLSHGDQQRDE